MTVGLQKEMGYDIGDLEEEKALGIRKLLKDGNEISEECVFYVSTTVCVTFPCIISLNMIKFRELQPKSTLIVEGLGDHSQI